MATAMLSAIIKDPVSADVAMTGEITLRGSVLPIGGLKEKLLQQNMPISKRFLCREKNKPDIQELDTEITDGLQDHFCKYYEGSIKRHLV